MQRYPLRPPARAARRRWLAVILASAAISVPAWAADVRPDPTLRAFVAQALQDNPGVQAAQSAVEAASADQRAASRPLYNPSVALNAQKASAAAASDQATLGIDQTIDWADKREAQAGVASGRLDERRALLAAVRQEVGGELLAALGRYWTARALQDLAQQRLSLMRRFLDLSERRRRAGDVSQTELDLARVAATQAQLNQVQAATDTAKAAQDVEAVTGTAVSRPPPLPQALPPLGDIDARAILAGLPRLRAQAARVAAARTGVDLARRRRTPDPTIGVRGGYEQPGAMVGVSVSVPLFIRNPYRAQVTAANAVLTQTEQQRQDVFRRAKARLLSAAARYRLARQGWTAWRTGGAPSMQNQLNLLERTWRAGELSTTDYLVQLNQSLATRADALAVRGRLWAAWFDWLVASGRIDQWLAATAR